MQIPKTIDICDVSGAVFKGQGSTSGERPIIIMQRQYFLTFFFAENAALFPVIVEVFS
jgi:hypothetical protein